MSSFSFQDKHGTDWDLSLTMASAKNIDKVDYSELTDVQFSFLVPDRDFFAEVFANKALVGALTFAIIEVDQLDKLDAPAGASREELELYFLKRLNGKSTRDMHRALLEAMADFFPEMETVLHTLVKRMDKVNSRLQKEMTEMAGQADLQFEKEIDKAFQKSRQELAEKLDEGSGEVSTPR